MHMPGQCWNDAGGIAAALADARGPTKPNFSTRGKYPGARGRQYNVRNRLSLVFSFVDCGVGVLWNEAYASCA
jgi:hypothetical protein